jgi:hypothetical protein
MLSELLSNPFYLIVIVGGVALFMLLVYLFLLLHNVEERVRNLEEAED